MKSLENSELDDHREAMQRFLFLKDSDLKVNDFFLLRPKVAEIMFYIANYCRKKNIRFVVTSLVRTKEQDKALGAKSSTHQEGRAFDFSIRREHGWTDRKLKEMQSLVNGRYLNDGAISFGSQKHKVIVIHLNANGEGSHAHVQVNRGA